jgi:hypothetical protein
MWRDPTKRSIFFDMPCAMSGQWCDVRNEPGAVVVGFDASSKLPLRPPQYEVIYSTFSDLSHASPSSVMITMGLAATSEQMHNWPGDFEKSEAEGLKLVLVLSTTWLLEILFIAKSEIPLYNLKWNFQVLRRIYELCGMKPPKLPWE